MIKFFALFVVVKQERGRIIRWMMNNRYKQDSGLEVYNLFGGRSELIGEEQPHSVYFMDKFMQPTHLYLHSNPADYPKTAQARNQTSSADWDQTVVIYEAFRAPVFIPAHLRDRYEDGRFEVLPTRADFNGTEEEYEQQLPGQFMDKWVSELATTQLVRLMDEMNTPDAKLPQYLFMQHCEHVWRMGVKANVLYKIWIDKYIS